VKALFHRRNKDTDVLRLKNANDTRKIINTWAIKKDRVVSVKGITALFIEK
jgi:hypothetical protein